VITPRRTQLVRVTNLQEFRQTIAGLTADAVQGSGREAVVIVVPTRGAAKMLERTLGDVCETAKPPIVTRDELYDLLHARLANPPRRLTALERDVIAQAAARAAASGE
jgi:hypothetical protein